MSRPLRIQERQWGIVYAGRTRPWHALEAGAGSLVLLLHGWGHSRQIWRSMLQHAPHSFLYLAPDLPGFGDAADIVDPSGVETIASMLEAFVAQVDPHPPITLVGDSLGAIVALRLVERGKIPLKSLFLSGCPFEGLPGALRRISQTRLVYWGLRLLRALPESLAHGMVKYASGLTFANKKAYTRVIAQAALAMQPQMASRILREISIASRLPSLQQLEAHGWFVVRGIRDRIVSPEAAAHLTKCLNAELVEIPNAGHTPMIENPAGYASALRAFLTNPS